MMLFERIKRIMAHFVSKHETNTSCRLKLSLGIDLYPEYDNAS